MANSHGITIQGGQNSDTGDYGPYHTKTVIKSSKEPQVEVYCLLKYPVR